MARSWIGFDNAGGDNNLKVSKESRVEIASSLVSAEQRV